MIENIKEINLAVVGLGYVGLPLAVAFGEKMDVVGYDINQERISRLKDGRDDTLELTKTEIATAKGLRFSSEEDSLSEANVFIVTVPTPIDQYNRPDLTHLIKSSEMIGRFLNLSFNTFKFVFRNFIFFLKFFC